MALLKTSHFLLTLVFLGISQVHSNEIQCQADPPNPVTFGDNINVTCTSTVKITSLKVTRPGSSSTDLFGKHKGQRLEKLKDLCSEKRWVFKIYNTNFTDSGTWKVIVQVPIEGGVEDEKTEFTIRIVKHPTKVQIKSLEGIEVSDKTSIVNLDDKDQDTKSFSCIAEGTKPAPTFEWKINDEPFDGNLIEKSEETFESELKVKIDRLDFKKVVTCQVYQVPSKSMNDSITIEAHFKPSNVSLMNKSDKVIDLVEGQEKESKVLTCVAENVNPKPTFEWMINDKSPEGSQLGNIEKFENASYKNSITIDFKR